MMVRMTTGATGLGQVLLGVLALAVCAAPVMLAKLFADTLDRTPYLITLSSGVGVAVVLCAVRWPAVRVALTGVASARPGAMATLVIVALSPTWAIGVGLGINRAFDHSPPVAHPCRVLAWQRPAKGRARCLVSSWRGNPSEALSDALVPSDADDGASPRGCTPGQRVEVSTRAGALGWEWIVGVRPL
jgi:hypothetical protein